MVEARFPLQLKAWNAMINDYLSFPYQLNNVHVQTSGPSLWKIFTRSGNHEESMLLFMLQHMIFCSSNFVKLDMYTCTWICDAIKCARYNNNSKFPRQKSCVISANVIKLLTLMARINIIETLKYIHKSIFVLCMIRWMITQWVLLTFLVSSYVCIRNAV